MDKENVRLYRYKHSKAYYSALKKKELLSFE